MEQSTLGDFKTRLHMLLTFHCHLATLTSENMEPGAMETVARETKDVAMESRIVLLRNLLWNLYNYYGQFLETVKAELGKLRGPIEKELKVFSSVMSIVMFMV